MSCFCYCPPTTRTITNPSLPSKSTINSVDSTNLVLRTWHIKQVCSQHHSALPLLGERREGGGGVGCGFHDGCPTSMHLREVHRHVSVNVRDQSRSSCFFLLDHDRDPTTPHRCCSSTRNLSRPEDPVHVSHFVRLRFWWACRFSVSFTCVRKALHCTSHTRCFCPAIKSLRGRS